MGRRALDRGPQSKHEVEEQRETRERGRVEKGSREEAACSCQLAKHESGLRSRSTQGAVERVRPFWAAPAMICCTGSWRSYSAPSELTAVSEGFTLHRCSMPGWRRFEMPLRHLSSRPSDLWATRQC